MADAPDPTGFRAFYRAELQPVTALALSLCRDRAVAEDVAQEAFTRAFRDWDQLRHYDRPGAWVRKVLVNLLRSRLRRQASRRRALARLRAEPALPTGMPEHDERFWEQVRSLPRNQALAIALFYVDDRPVAEIAELVGCAESTARVHLHRGRAALAEKLGIEDGGKP